MTMQPLDAKPKRSPSPAVPSSEHHSARKRPPLGRSHDVDMPSPISGSSEGSPKTSLSDARNWFDQSNLHPEAAALESGTMEVDSPFYQKQSDSSVGDKSQPYQQMAAQEQDQTHSSGSDDYRSVIDDLTVEIQRLKKELKKYKQRGPETLRKDKLFEIKIHGLPKKKKRELETTLRDFAARVGESSTASSSQLKVASSQATRHHLYSGSRSKYKSTAMSMSMSKHASSSSGSNNRPADSAYASMSTRPPLGRPQTKSRMRLLDQKVENYLRDIPEGLYPRHVAMTEKAKKKLVVRRIEHIFTGKMAVRPARRHQADSESGTAAASRRASDRFAAKASVSASVPAPGLAPVETFPRTHLKEPSREAQFLPLEHRSGRTGKETGSQDIASAPNSHEDRTEFAATGKQDGSGSGLMRANPLSTGPAPPEQRPTRLKDLDPDRVQDPSENMEYIRHLGIVPPELCLPDSGQLGHDVQADADGWVYLNLLCNMAQLHIMNVTPDFVRAAVTELSTQFQLSPGGHQIRWRGGTEGTKFSSDCSGGCSQGSPETDDAENSKGGARKRQKIDRASGDDKHAFDSNQDLPAARPPAWSSQGGILHYQPLFVRAGAPNDDLPADDDPASSPPPTKERRDSVSGWSGNGSTSTPRRRKRRLDGAIIYYSGAPFCTDLSGDVGDASQSSPISPGFQDRTALAPHLRSPNMRSRSSSEAESEPLEFGRPLSDRNLQFEAALPIEKLGANSQVGGGIDDSTIGQQDDEGSELDWQLPWSDGQQSVGVQTLEPCGLGGVLPEDRFMVIVATERSKDDAKPLAEGGSATRSLSDSLPQTSGKPAVLEVRYTTDTFKRLTPEPLPPPSAFFAALSADSWSGEEDEEPASSEALPGRLAHPYESTESMNEMRFQE